MKFIAGFLALAVAALAGGFSCRSESARHNSTSAQPVAAASPDAGGAVARPPVNAATAEEVPVYGFEVVHAWPHDASAFTQGLVFHDGVLFESTGLYGRSSLRRVELQTGKVLKKIDVPAQFFGEGLALFRGKLFQLTWTNQKGFVYDPESFEKVGEFRFDGQGWGLTHDEQFLIMSDGTNQIRFIDPSSFKVRRTISVFDRGAPLRDLNELEYVRGEIFANVWHEDRIARIDPQTGKITGWVDLSGIISRSELRTDEDAVLNGIAYDAAGDRLFVTGKFWPKLFEIRLKR